MTSDTLSLLDDLIAKAKKAGADAADALAIAICHAHHQGAASRLQKVRA